MALALAGATLRLNRVFSRRIIALGAQLRRSLRNLLKRQRCLQMSFRSLFLLLQISFIDLRGLFEELAQNKLSSGDRTIAPSLLSGVRVVYELKLIWFCFRFRVERMVKVL